VENKQDKASELHTHEDIMRVFKDLEIIEAKVKNPTLYGKELLQSTTRLTEFERHVHRKVDVLQPPRQHKPQTEVTERQEEPRHPFWKKKDTQEPETKKPKRFPFMKTEKNMQQEPDTPVEVEEQFSDVPITRSTFVLQLDENGNLVGLPIKKPKPDQTKGRFSLRKATQENAEGESTEQPAEGIRGKLQQISSLFHRKASSESESSSGIGGKLKGLFRRT
jgi:hypothetical protein